MRNIEIPLQKDKDKVYRLFEALPGILSWSILFTPAILSLINPTWAAYFVIGFLLLWFIKILGLNIRMLQGYRRLHQNMAYDWLKMLKELDCPEKTFERYQQGVWPKWHQKNLIKNYAHENRLRLDDIYHVLIVAHSIEGKEVLEPTIKSLLRCQYDMKKVILIMAYEERCEPLSKEVATDLTDKYKNHFYHMEAVCHPSNIPNEVVGKGGNITYAGRWAKKYLEDQQIPYENVIVTTLDSDNRPHPMYFASVTYAYLVCPDRLHTSFQPITVYTNNIWDVPAPMRVMAAGNSFWNIVLSLRPHMLRNFSSHSQSMQALIDTDFWSVRTIVEDGHQFWRTYLRYNGKHDVHPIMVPVYLDAVFAGTYKKTIIAQFKQIRRWAWGASDVAFLLQRGWRDKNNIPKFDLLTKTCRLIESHVSWATAPLLLLLGAFVPLYTAPQARTNLVANQLPVIASRIQTVAMIGLFVSIYLSIRLLPPKPPRYKARHRFYMIIQWVYLPFTTIIFNSFAAINSQTRLIFGRYVGKFEITEKKVKH